MDRRSTSHMPVQCRIYLLSRRRVCRTPINAAYRWYSHHLCEIIQNPPLRMTSPDGCRRSVKEARCGVQITKSRAPMQGRHEFAPEGIGLAQAKSVITIEAVTIFA